MKTKLVSLFLKREHLILLSRMLQLSEVIMEQDQIIINIDLQHQKSENKILKTEKWPQFDLDFLQNTFLQIANLTFSYFKFHFPVNSSLYIKEHIRFIQCMKQINFGGVTIEEVFKQQRLRLSSEIQKLNKPVKITEEPRMPKIMNYKIDVDYISSIQTKYFYPINHDYLENYQILNLKKHSIQKTTVRPNRELYQSITSFEDIPPFQQLNSSMIQPILNYEILINSYDYRFNKLMQRNQLISSSIKNYSNKIKLYEETFQYEQELQDICFEIKKQFCFQINLLFDRKEIKINQQSPQITKQQFYLNQLNSPIKLIDQTKESITQRERIQSKQTRLISDQNLPEIRQSPNLFLNEKLSSNQINGKISNTNSEQTINTIKSIDIQSAINSTKRYERHLRQPRNKNEKSTNLNKILSVPQQNIITLSTNYQESQSQENICSSHFFGNKNSKFIDKVALKPIIYSSVKLKEFKDLNILSDQMKKSEFQTQYPYIKEQNSKQIQKTDFEKSKQDQLPIQIQSQRKFNIQEKDEGNVTEIFFQRKNKSTNLQSQLILLTRSEQLLTSLISTNAIKGTELYQQLLQPIKIHSTQKFLTPKSNQVTEAKFKKIKSTAKLFQIK